MTGLGEEARIQWHSPTLGVLGVAGSLFPLLELGQLLNFGQELLSSGENRTYLTCWAQKESLPFFFLKILFYFIDSRERGREREREEENYQCERETSLGCLLHVPQLGTQLQPRHVPRPGIKPVTFRFVG